MRVFKKIDITNLLVVQAEKYNPSWSAIVVQINLGKSGNSCSLSH